MLFVLAHFGSFLSVFDRKFSISWHHCQHGFFDGDGFEKRRPILKFDRKGRFLVVRLDKNYHWEVRNAYKK